MEASIVGQPMQGLIVKGVPKVEPATVKTMGPRSVVEVVQVARAEPFTSRVSPKRGSHQRSLPLDWPPSRVTFASATVTVTIEVAREEMQRVFVKVPVQLVGVARAL